MKILIAPDKFKGALSAREVAENIGAGLREVLPDATIDLVPMADGGEGTAEAICGALNGRWLTCKAHDPLGREIEARYCWIEEQHRAVMEMSEAGGMRRLRPNESNPEVASTFGVGEMLIAAAERGAVEIIIGLGGSATNDGGFGMARALGFRFLDKNGDEIRSHLDLVTLDRIVPSTQSSPSERGRRKEPSIVAAVDVKNPLLGENGATRIFGPQKGVRSEQIDSFERSLARLADVVSRQFSGDHRNDAGAGAAGGLGFGLMSFCGAMVKPGFDVVAEAVGLESKMKDVDVVITGEGSLDRQTLEGKTPAGVARLARKLDKPVFALAGRATQDREVVDLFDGVYQNARPDMAEQENMARAAELLKENARLLGKRLKSSNLPPA